MKATKLLAVLLAVLMVIPAMVMPTAAADATAANTAADPYALKYEFTQFEASETPYFVQHGAGKDSASDWDGRNGEGNGTIWKFPLSNPSQMENAINKLTKFTVTAKTRNEVVLLLSLDNVNYTEVYSILTDPNLKVDDSRWCLNPAVRTYDFTDELYALLKTNPEAEYVYLKLSDALKGEVSVNGDYTAVGGYGGCFIKNTPVVVEINYDKDTYYTHNVTTFTPSIDDGNYVYRNTCTEKDKVGNFNTVRYYLDENAANAGKGVIQYSYAMTDSQLPEKLTWTASVGQKLNLEFSVNNDEWVPMFFHNEGNGAAMEYRTFDITEAYLEQVAKHPSNMLYIRLRNSVPGTGYGGAIDYKPVTLDVGYEKQQISGDQITLDWSVHGEDQGLYYVGGASTNYADKEKKYPVGLYTDRTRWGVMRYPITNADLSSEILFTAKVGAQFLLQVSLDGTNYVDAFRYNNEGAWATDSTSSKGFPTIERTFDLTVAVKKAAEKATSKNNLYIRWGDSEPDTNGYGGQLHGMGYRQNDDGSYTLVETYDTTLNIRSAEGMEYGYVVRQNVITGPIEMRTDGDYKGTYQFTATPDLPWADYRGGQPWNKISPAHVDATGATPILNGGVGRGNSTIKEAGASNYYADGGYYVLRYELPEGANKWHFTATMGNQIGIYVAYGDEITPHPETDAARYTKLTDYLAMGLTGSGDYKTNYTVTDTATDEELKDGRYVYLLFTDDDWYQVKLNGGDAEALQKARGWGGAILLGKNYPITMCAYLSTEAELCNTTEIGYVPYAHTVKESFTISKAKLQDADKKTYTYAETEPVLVAAATTAGFSTDIKEANVFTDEVTGELYTTGDGNWNSRFGNNKAVTVYRYKLPKYATKFDWTAKVGGDYGIYIAYASDTPADNEWKLVKNYLEDGYKVGQHPNATKMTISDDISADELAKGYVYLKFVDYDYVLYGTEGYTPEGGETIETDNGYGCRIVMGSNHSVDMVWTLSGEDRDVAQSVSSAQLSLTENFNLNFKLILPLSSKGDEIVTITWADGKPVEKVTKKNGGYLVEDILPQDMTKDLVVTFSGTCMDNTKYTSKTFTYSVKDYCMRMLSRDEAYYADAYGFTAEKTAAFKQLLSDMLAYGAAAQKYVFDDGELATDGVVGLKPSTFKALDKAVYENVLSRQATGEDGYKWAGVTLVLDNTVAIRYTLYTEAAAPIVMVNGTAYTPVAADEANYYYVDVPVYAGNFATEYVASFDGVEGYTLTYSVYHYVARKYNPNTLVTGDLIAALYNYGTSAAAYVAK